MDVRWWLQKSNKMLNLCHSGLFSWILFCFFSCLTSCLQCTIFSKGNLCFILYKLKWYMKNISYFRYNFQTRQHPCSIWSEKSVVNTLISWTSLVILKSSAVSSVSLSSATSIFTCIHSTDWDFLSFEQKHTIIIIQLSCAGLRQNKWHRST